MGARAAGDADLDDAPAAGEHLHEHLGLDVVAAGLEAEAVDGAAADGAEAGLGVGDAGAEEEVERAGEGEVADAVDRGDRAVFEAPEEARPHDELDVGREGAEEAGDLLRRVLPVAVEEHHHVARDAREALADGGPLAPVDGHPVDARPRALGLGRGVVARAVVYHEHLAEAGRVGDAAAHHRADGGTLVVGRDEHAHPRRRGHVGDLGVPGGLHGAG